MTCRSNVHTSMLSHWTTSSCRPGTPTWTGRLPSWTKTPVSPVKVKTRALVLNLIPAHEHSHQKSFSVCPLIEAQQSSTEESEPTAQPQEPLEEVTGPRDDHRVRVLFERCLIACALYEEFWTRVNIITNAKNTWNQQWSHLYVLYTFCMCPVHSVPGVTQCRGGASGL